MVMFRHTMAQLAPCWIPIRRINRHQVFGSFVITSQAFIVSVHLLAGNLFKNEYYKYKLWYPCVLLPLQTWDFMVAGRDTTACASTWLMYYFATRPDVVQRIRCGA